MVLLSNTASITITPKSNKTTCLRLKLVSHKPKLNRITFTKNNNKKLVVIKFKMKQY